MLKDAKAQVSTTHQPPPQAPPTALPIAADSAYTNTPVASEKRREPNTNSPTYANIDLPSSSSTLAAARPSKHHSHPKPFPESPRVPQEDHMTALEARRLPPPQVLLFPASRTDLIAHVTTLKWMLTSGVDQGMWTETPWHSLRALHHPPQPGCCPHTRDYH